MGNLCSSEDSKHADNFAGPGRTVGTAPPPRPDANARASVPSNVQTQRPQGPGRTLGGGSDGGRGRDAGIDTAQAAGGGHDPRAAAARAAEERAQRAQGTGKLGRQLDAQKRQTRAEVLGQASRENRRARDADEAAEARNWS